MKTKNAILVWRFADAPAELQALSGNGGDEDWLVAVPPGMLKEPGVDGLPAWMVSHAFDAANDPQVIDCGENNGEWGGWTIVIASHS